MLPNTHRFGFLASIALLSIVLSCTTGCGSGPGGLSSSGSGGALVSNIGRSTNMWVALPGPFGSGTTTHIEAIGVDSVGVVYAATKGQVSRSADGGKTWSLMSTGLPNAPITAIGFNSLNQPLAGVGFNPALGVYRYVQGSWHLATGVSASYRISAFTLDKTGAVVVVTSWGGDVYRSTNLGSTFVKVASNIGVNAAMWTVVTAPDGSLLAGGESTLGLLHSIDDGHTWQSAGLETVNGYKGNIFGIGFGTSGVVLVGRASAGGAIDMQEFKGGVWAAGATGMTPYKTVLGVVNTLKGNVFTFVQDPPAGSEGAYLFTQSTQTWSDVSSGLLPNTSIEQMARDPYGYVYAIDQVNNADACTLFKTQLAH